MRIANVQLHSFKGDIDKNIEKHISFINKSLTSKPDLIVFPELSLIGYEPDVVKDTATTKDDKRFDVFQTLSNEHKVIICVGVPTKEGDKLHVSMIIFQPGKERITYSKQYLYHTEVELFSPSHSPLVLKVDDNNIIAPTICYELANDEHQEYANKNGADIYFTSVCNSIKGVDIDIERLSQIAKKYKMAVTMSNYVGFTGGNECGGKTSAWNSQGELIGQLDGKSEGILIFDTKNNDVEKIKII